MRSKLLSFLVALMFSTAAHGMDTVIGIDMNSDIPGDADATYVGLGALSTTGTNWNGFGNTEAGGLLDDEFGNPTPVEVIRTLNSFVDAQGAANNLQNFGSGGGGSWKVVGLILGQTYETAWYLGLNTGIFFGIDHGGLNDFVVTPGNPTYVMPGTVGLDYGLLTITAKDLGNGEIGFALDEGGLDGSLLGLQISGPVDIPQPASLAIGVLMIVAGLARRRR